MQSQISTSGHSRFQHILESIEALSSEDQEMLVDIVQKRLRDQRRASMDKAIKDVQQEYHEGKVTLGTVDDFLAALDQE